VVVKRLKAIVKRFQRDSKSNAERLQIERGTIAGHLQSACKAISKWSQSELERLEVDLKAIAK
jgi:hypothetical protein